MSARLAGSAGGESETKCFPFGALVARMKISTFHSRQKAESLRRHSKLA
jgi:hypothetical protein